MKEGEVVEQCGKCDVLQGVLQNSDGLTVAVEIKVCDPMGDGQAVLEDLQSLIQGYMNEQDGVTDDEMDSVEIILPNGDKAELFVS